MEIKYKIELLLNQSPDGKWFNLNAEQIVRYSNLSREKAVKTNRLREIMGIFNWLQVLMSTT
jgi:hypothetical protein